MFQDVCLISPCDISREGLSNILLSEGFRVTGSFQDVDEVGAASVGPDVIALVDCANGRDQSDAIDRLKTIMGCGVVVVLAERFDLKAMVDCFHSGAHGYIIKSMKALPLIASLKLAAMGERVLPSDLVDVLDRRMNPIRMPAHIDAVADDVNLSPREMDVLCCLMAGCSNKVIARQLDVCEATVKVHVKAILRKLNVHNRTQAAMWASARGYSENQAAH